MNTRCLCVENASSSTLEKCIHTGMLSAPGMFHRTKLIQCRLPVPDLYIDIFEKIKALGYNGVSFYVDWALLEGKPGEYRADGVFDLQPFFDAATKTGIYLIARPGPYINAEVSGGGFPGWLQRINGTLRTSAKDFLESTDKYETQTLIYLGDD